LLRGWLVGSEASQLATRPLEATTLAEDRCGGVVLVDGDPLVRSSVQTRRRIGQLRRLGDAGAAGNDTLDGLLLIEYQHSEN